MTEKTWLDEAMPVLWAAGRRRAHLMSFDGRALSSWKKPRKPPHEGSWRSRCGWELRREYGALHDATRGDLPPVPWCTGCQRYGQRIVAGYLLAGIAQRTLPGLEGMK